MSSALLNLNLRQACFEGNLINAEQCLKEGANPLVDDLDCFRISAEQGRLDILLLLKFFSRGKVFISKYLEIAQKVVDERMKQPREIVQINEDDDLICPPAKKIAIPDGMKRCCHCKKILSLDNFGSVKSMKDGKSRKCKACRNVAQQGYRHNVRANCDGRRKLPK
jgi:hypothetical protein